jgi:hypothetical protein
MTHSSRSKSFDNIVIKYPPTAPFYAKLGFRMLYIKPNLSQSGLNTVRLVRPHPAVASGSGSPLSCRFFIRGRPPNKNAAPKLGRGVGGEGKINDFALTEPY